MSQKYCMGTGAKDTIHALNFHLNLHKKYTLFYSGIHMGPIFHSLTWIHADDVTVCAGKFREPKIPMASHVLRKEGERPAHSSSFWLNTQFPPEPLSCQSCLSRRVCANAHTCVHVSAGMSLWHVTVYLLVEDTFWGQSVGIIVMHRDLSCILGDTFVCLHEGHKPWTYSDQDLELISTNHGLYDNSYKQTTHTRMHAHTNKTRS